ncbi:uncharacterized protein LOC111872270 [Cryptotermes secundus]|uniref:uncharacterized protein LOC111872270 n=1 Tax=Cryptotermes secundus TaxID=105785 RepID=UPI000CD7CE1D|nr:uncharacterized protein LOC111872270 [Cryptotermes secundus]
MVNKRPSFIVSVVRTKKSTIMCVCTQSLVCFLTNSDKYLRLGTGMVIILAKRAEQIFPAVRERMNCTNSENVLVGPCGETYPASHDANQPMNIKAEEVTDSEEEVDPLKITVQEIKAEPEERFYQFEDNG